MRKRIFVKKTNIEDYDEDTPHETLVADVAATLRNREMKYGSFKTLGDIARVLKGAMHYQVEVLSAPGHVDSRPGWDRLTGYQREALDMIASKIARILNGDPNYVDNWHDIAGYATLVVDELEKTNGTV